MSHKSSQTDSAPDVLPGEMNVAGEAALNLVKHLPDVHHNTLIAATRHAGAAQGVMGTLSSYLERVDHLQRSDQMFEKVEVEVNVGCNRRCTYCYLATDSREAYTQSHRKTMDWDLFRLFVQQLSDIRFEGVICYHFYGEPLVNKEVGSYISYTKEHLPETKRMVYTNGDLLTSEKHRQLTDAGVTLFLITRHDNVIPDFLMPVLKESNVLLDTRENLLLNNRAGLLGTPTDPRIRSLPCIFTSEALIVTIDGNVLPCSCDFRESMLLGNLRKTHISEIYRSEKCRNFRRDLLAGHRGLYPLCQNCDFYCEVLGIRSGAESHRAKEQPTLTQIRRELRKHVQ